MARTLEEAEKSFELIQRQIECPRSAIEFDPTTFVRHIASLYQDAAVDLSSVRLRRHIDFTIARKYPQIGAFELRMIDLRVRFAVLCCPAGKLIDVQFESKECRAVMLDSVYVRSSVFHSCDSVGFEWYCDSGLADAGHWPSVITSLTIEPLHCVASGDYAI